ncbi:hypothetical protein PILCRDRAFT_844 [Piloderma croceum F 1598]|uniref:Uncharacterized protein n=1 Tax=Piloderma croceum (strain F 1598) TaxID=765440 RepID=A0A0C3CPX3_PILCF|nr:hypothetical protein PILCRDRAFT_844 [Piloderma croceum F 1598]
MPVIPPASTATLETVASGVPDSTGPAKCRLHKAPQSSTVVWDNETEKASNEGSEIERSGKRQHSDQGQNNLHEHTSPPAAPAAGDSLSDFQPSPPVTPLPAPPVEQKPFLSETEIQAKDNFLARLQAKAAKAVTPAPNLPPQTSPADTAQYTPCPANGFPLVHGWNSTHPFDNIDYTQIVDWLQLPGPRIFVQPLGHGYYPPAVVQEIVGLLKTTIEDILGCAGVKITAPIAAAIPNSPDHAPYTYLVRNISEDVAAKLIEQGCWVSKKIGFLVYTAQTSLPTYVGGIQGFSASDEEDIATIRSLVQRGFSGPEIAPIIAEISAEGDLRHLPEEECITKILDTLGVQMVNIHAPGGSLRPIANLYINCSFDNDEGWTRLVNAIAKLEYRNSLIGTGVYHPG